MTVHDAAREYVAAGLSVHPVRADGSKAPLLMAWTIYAERRPDEDELKRWYGNGTVAGIGIPGGPASGNLAVLDFESMESWERFLGSMPSDTADFLDECPTVKTPGDGMHLYCRLPESVRGTVLARHADKSVMVEIRGNGHYVVAPGSPAACHKAGRPYEFVRRGWLDGGTAPVVPMSVFATWCGLIADMNEFVAPARPQTPPRAPERTHTDVEPGTDFSRRGTWEQTGIFGAGWSWSRRFDDQRGLLTRPGKAEGVSATVGMVHGGRHDVPFLHVFTSNGHPFEADQSYDRFGVFARLQHAGDFRAAARALAALGYGEQREPGDRRASVPVVQPQTTPSDPITGAAVPVVEADASTAVAVIAAYFRQCYRPDFRRGNAIHTSGGEIIPMGVACEVPTSRLIEQLSQASDAPRYRGGAVNRDSLPGFFKRWAKVAWGDLLASLPDEDSAKLEPGSCAADEFRKLVREAMLSEVVIGDVIGKEDVTRTERRSLIDWCEKWAKTGPWRSIRSKKCWCKIATLGGGEIRLRVAIRHELFAQVKADRRLTEMSMNTFTRRATRYAVGTSARDDRPHGLTAVVLADDFVDSLVSGIPDDHRPDDSPVR